MTKEEVFDINGKSPKVGDKIALSIGYTTNNSYLDIATIDEIIERDKTVKLNLTVQKLGKNYRIEVPEYEKHVSIQFPMSHCKFVIL